MTMFEISLTYLIAGLAMASLAGVAIQREPERFADKGNTAMGLTLALCVPFWPLIMVTTVWLMMRRRGS